MLVTAVGLTCLVTLAWVVSSAHAAARVAHLQWHTLSVRAGNGAIASDGRYLLIGVDGHRPAVILDTRTNRHFEIRAPAGVTGCSAPVIGSARLLITCDPGGDPAALTAWILEIATRRWSEVPASSDALTEGAQTAVGRNWAEFRPTDEPATFINVRTGQVVAPTGDSYGIDLDNPQNPNPPVCSPLSGQNVLAWITASLAVLESGSADGDPGDLYVQQCGTGRRHTLSSAAYVTAVGNGWLVWSASDPLLGYNSRTGQEFRLSQYQPAPGMIDLLAIAGGRLYETGDDSVVHVATLPAR